MASKPAAGAPALPATLPAEPLLRLLGRTGSEFGTRTFLVGGPVRDLLLGLSGPDLDIAVESSPDLVGQALAERFGTKFVYHRRFMSGTVQLADGSHIDITRTRTEEYPGPAVLPRVRPAGIENDLVRRDFTINALALELSPGSFGRLIDPHCGRLDLARRQVRVLHDASFRDDPTRSFRAIRFAVRLGFEIEPGTLALMRTAIREGFPGLLTPERVLYELRLVCAEPLVLPMVEALLREKLLHACFDSVAERGLLRRLQRLAGTDPGLLFVFLLSRLPLTDRFPVTAGERDAARAIRDFDRLRPRLARARRPSTVHRLLAPLPDEALEVLARTEAAAVRSPIRLYLDRLRHVRTAVDGRFLRSLGLKPGPAFRRIIENVHAARLDGRVGTREQEIALGRRLARRQETG